MRVHGSVYVDPEIFELEMQRVFGRAWVFLGHESQACGAGDYYATHIGREPVMMLRGKDGVLRGFYNRCAHKGAQLVPDGAGQMKAIRCGYHGWIYGLDGALRTVPAQKGYGERPVKPGACDYGMAALPGFASYRGFVFGRLAADGPSLEEWLGPMAGSLDNFVDRAPLGEIEVAGGVLRYDHACNWKFFMENTLDALHPMVVHMSAARPARAVAAQLPQGADALHFELQALAPFSASYDFFDEMGARVMPHGHADLGGKASIHSAYAEVDAYWRAMVEGHGEKRASQILSVSRNNSIAYPSLMLKAPVQLLRVVRPLAVDRTIIETWHFRLKGAPPSTFQRTIAYSTLVNSSAGMVGPDDHEIYRRMQAGLKAGQPEWVELGRYADLAPPGPDGATEVPGTSDALFRGQFQAWLDLMEAA
ncbi:phenylpropionate dioxygenase-like ring-hydroxylating dioxygenase large terminal subunit [Novosphingobium sp. SG751A]|uniref:aromatic ring-hydroxylating oxygenase subunit alpha n=1 Tax=Novosphingobium sp. SG751A TaxID=2587000 RepID=UPI001556FAC1|nr:Rieske 2Fe-2S domain-containing protein [Novosphingobium sp. SG751A]NOW45377.1 phenylpropionate dioxygenase-like ring-hydroxylating dioxygenase large terminal subunit [Novosphingobium sp. SG751A]